MDETIPVMAMAMVLATAVWMVDWAGRVTLARTRLATVANELVFGVERRIEADSAPSPLTRADNAARWAAPKAVTRTAGMCVPPVPTGPGMVQVGYTNAARSHITVTLRCDLAGSALFIGSLTVESRPLPVGP